MIRSSKKQAWRGHPAASKFCLLSALCRFLAWLTLQPCRWRQYVPLKDWLTFTGLHSIISQNIELCNKSCHPDLILINLYCPIVILLHMKEQDW
jgi:hypothetical protein